MALSGFEFLNACFCALPHSRYGNTINATEIEPDEPETRSPKSEPKSAKEE
jgi:hypothetical protein